MISAAKQNTFDLLDELIERTEDEYENEELQHIRGMLRESDLDIVITYDPDDQWGAYHLSWKEERIGQFRTANATAYFVQGFLWGYSAGFRAGIEWRPEQ